MEYNEQKPLQIIEFNVGLIHQIDFFLAKRLMDLDMRRAQMLVGRPSLLEVEVLAASGGMMNARVSMYTQCLTTMLVQCNKYLLVCYTVTLLVNLGI